MSAPRYVRAGRLRLAAGKSHEVDLRLEAGVGTVSIDINRHNRRRAAGDLALELSASAARDLMRALQGAADDADRQAYRVTKEREQAERTRVRLVAFEVEGDGESLESAVNAVAAALEGR